MLNPENRFRKMTKGMRIAAYFTYAYFTLAALYLIFWK